jgi:hypothetical protein
MKIKQRITPEYSWGATSFQIAGLESAEI